MLISEHLEKTAQESCEEKNNFPLAGAVKKKMGQQTSLIQYLNHPILSSSQKDIFRKTTHFKWCFE